MEVERCWIRIFLRCKFEKDDVKCLEKKMCSVERVNCWSFDICFISLGFVEVGVFFVMYCI